MPRWWDARYCGDDRVLVVAEGELRLFEAPSGKLSATAAAPHATSLVSCEGGVARTSDPRATELRSFALTATTIKVVPPPSDAPTK